MDHPVVSVIVLNWNLKDDTVACVDSLLAGSCPRQQIIVVDNGSLDGSGAVLADKYKGQIDLILNEENLGFAAGMNVGMRHALACGAESVLLLNNDTVVDANAIDCLLQVSGSDPGVGILGPAIYYYDDPQRFWRLGAIDRRWSPLPVEVGRDAIDRGQFESPIGVDYVTGCAMWIRSEVLREIGMLDEAYFMYYEDADFCRRARDAGHRIAVVPEARVWHKVSKSARRQPATSHYHRTRTRIRFYRQHRQDPLIPLTHVVLWGQELSRLGRAAALGRFDVARAGWRGLVDGYREQVDEPRGTD